MFVVFFFLLPSFILVITLLSFPSILYTPSTSSETYWPACHLHCPPYPISSPIIVLWTFLSILVIHNYTFFCLFDIVAVPFYCKFKLLFFLYCVLVHLALVIFPYLHFLRVPSVFLPVTFPDIFSYDPSPSHRDSHHPSLNMVELLLPPSSPLCCRAPVTPSGVTRTVSDTRRTCYLVTRL